ncbi:hypothetical protein [Zhongshania sp. BJYM1]|uniref:hypothetical protein n=1 Tax=Zhongshania aquatica TaxID=2965069 RepID=UPI0022B482D3|nr:hypothetical protein [Marortus sp. BJYM1]
MSHKFAGHCQCSEVQLSLSLPKHVDHYTPRACDCDFCLSRDASYLSDPDGRLQITAFSPLNITKQGSEQALFLSCARCCSLVAVVYPFTDGLKGAVNATFLSEVNHQRSIPVSPKQLSPDDKYRRWQDMWLTVSINGKNHL